MKRWVCTVCGYDHNGDNPPELCPVCHEKSCNFKEARPRRFNFDMCNEANKNNRNICENCLKEILEAHYISECEEVGRYIALSRMAKREGYDEIADTLRRIALEEAEHAASFYELINEERCVSLEDQLRRVATCEFEATEQKLKLSRKAKESSLTEAYKILESMVKDEAGHGKLIQVLLAKYF